MQLGEPDESGRRRPLPIEGSQWTGTFDHVITAIGQKSDHYVFGEFKASPRQGKITYHSDIPVFCAGDMAWGGTVTEAIGSGNKAAAELDAYLRNMPYDSKETLPEIVLPEDINYTYYLPTPRHQAQLYHPENFHHDFTEVARDMDEKDIVDETERCLHCGDCYLCGNCFNYCPDAAILVDDKGRIRIDYDYCKGCGICVQECPCSAIEFKLSEAEAI
jgi:2-oxoacid:acceptor oxidoreductase delta subunit (pyruvate/2-ketoisovalerate family)